MKELKTIMVSLDELYLDPNNYRLRSNLDYEPIDEEAEFQKSVQKRTFDLVVGESKHLVSELISSFKTNDFLKIDNILIRRRKDKYIVVEGNRRIAALKLLQLDHKNGIPTGNLSLSIFKKNGIECVEYEYESDEKYLILMGLKHVSGNKKWDLYNQATLISQLESKWKKDRKTIASMVGLLIGDVNKRIKGYHAITEYIESLENMDIQDDFNPHDHFQMFLQLVGSPKLREWGQWDEATDKFIARDNIMRFYNWITPILVYDDESESPIQQPPIINSHKQIRKLAEIIDDDEALTMMEESGNLEITLDTNVKYSQKQFSKLINGINNDLLNLRAKAYKKPKKKDLDIIKEIIDFLKDIRDKK